MGLNKFSAHEAVNKLDEQHLRNIFKYFGDEKNANLIARKIIYERKKNFINTEDLVTIIDSSYKKNIQNLTNLQKYFKH